jgi:hypothetical protein
MQRITDPCSQISKSSGSVKADQWRSQFTILFVALFDAWQIDGEIPDEDAPRSPAGSKARAEEDRIETLVRTRARTLFLATHQDPTLEELESIQAATSSRNYRQHFDVILQLTVAIRILGSRQLSPNDVLRGCSAMTRAFQQWARMNVHMTPYFHLIAHYSDPFLAMGPAYGWWTYPYERNNGYLGRFKHNGHAGGELEATMMRGWWKSLFVHELVSDLCTPSLFHADTLTDSAFREHEEPLF